MNRTLLFLTVISIFPLAHAVAEPGFPDFESMVRDSSNSVSKDIKAARIGQATVLKAKSYAGSTRCRPESEQDPKLYSSDFKWNYTLPELKARFKDIYRSASRLPRRAYWNSRQARLEFPYDDSQGGPVVITEALVQAVTRHIERAFELDYIDAVFFPDMGHSHLLVPQALWDDKYSRYEVSEFSQLYAGMLSDPQVEIFYHTAEQLRARKENGALVDDPRTQWRYKTRNIAGAITPDAELRVLQNPESTANTVNGVPGYFWWGAGFNLSSNENGCFAYSIDGKTFRFDMSLYDLGPDPHRESGDYYY